MNDRAETREPHGETRVRVGLTLHGSLLSEDGARFARQLGVEDVVIHLTDYARNANPACYLAGGVGPINGECIDAPAWSYEHMAGVVAMLARHGLKVAAMENISPNFWSDILLDGPDRSAQMEGMKRLVRDAGRAGIPVIGYNFSMAGVWGWRRRRLARGGAMTAVMDLTEMDGQSPIPDGMVGNMRYRAAVPARPRSRVDEPSCGSGSRGSSPSSCRWQRRRACGSPRIPTIRRSTPARHRAARQCPEKYDRLLALAPSPANALEFCIGSLAEMAGATSTRPPGTSRARAPSPMSTSAMCAARCRATSRPSWTTATWTWPRWSASCRGGLRRRAGAGPRAGTRLPRALARRATPTQSAT